MKTIKVKNTKNIRLSGKPSQDLLEIKDSGCIALSPSLVDLIKPKLLVKIGDKVKVGTPIYYDKQDENLVFVSPASGVIKDIVYGNRRSLDNVVIDCDDTQEYESRSTIDIDSVGVDDLKKSIISGGLWGSFKQFPFLDIPKTNEDLPDDIYVSLDNDEPHSPLSEVYLKNNLDDFKRGVLALKKLFTNVHIACRFDNKEVVSMLGV